MEQFELNKNQLQFITLLSLRPETNLTVRETARLLNWSPSTASRIIHSLETIGLITAAHRGRAKFVKLNQNYPSAKEIKNLAIKHYGIIPVISKTLRPIGTISLATIYGSAAGGRLDNKSDIDLLLVGTPNQDELNRQFENIERLFGREVNYTLFSPQEYRQSIKQSPFLRNIMKQTTIELIRR